MVAGRRSARGAPGGLTPESGCSVVCISCAPGASGRSSPCSRSTRMRRVCTPGRSRRVRPAGPR